MIELCESCGKELENKELRGHIGNKTVCLPCLNAYDINKVRIIKNKKVKK